MPLFSPDEPGHPTGSRRCSPTVRPPRSSPPPGGGGGARLLRPPPAKQRPRVIAVDAVPDSVGSGWTPPVVGPEHNLDTIAYLQYTSGSTRTPAGVEITHRAVATNVLQICDTIEINKSARGVTWLPLFHDMGLLTVILPALGGSYITIMSPQAFIRRPAAGSRNSPPPTAPRPTPPRPTAF